MLLTSCESKSGQLVAQPLEKVVVIDSYNEEYDHINKDITYRKYKVKRIEFGVIDVIFDARLLEAGDTVFYRFAKHVTP